jgi:hypothetical protein
MGGCATTAGGEAGDTMQETVLSAQTSTVSALDRIQGLTADPAIKPLTKAQRAQLAAAVPQASALLSSCSSAAQDHLAAVDLDLELELELDSVGSLGSLDSVQVAVEEVRARQAIMGRDLTGLDLQEALTALTTDAFSYQDAQVTRNALEKDPQVEKVANVQVPPAKVANEVSLSRRVSS